VTVPLRRIEVVRAALWASRLDRLRLGRGTCPGYELAEVSPGEAGELARAMDVPAGVVLGRLARGARAWAVWSPEAAIASWLWVSVGQERADPIRRTMALAPDEAYGWNAGTVPAHRDRSLFTSLLLAAAGVMWCEGRSVMWNGIHDHNRASQRAHASAGFRPVLRMSALLLGDRSLIRTRRVDYADPELVERAQRLLTGPTSSRPGPEALAGLATATDHPSDQPALPANRSQRRNAE
jgi:hypothetical protein